MAEGLGGHDPGELVVEHQGAIVDIDGQDGVRTPALEILHHHQAQTRIGKTERAQGDELGDGVVLAVAAAGEQLDRRRPIVPGAVIQ